MTLTLNPATEARLRSVAHQRGLAPEATLDAVLAEAEDREMQAELRASVEDYAAGRSMTVGEYRAKALNRSWEASA